jgi:glycosyltransferase involved in cell wall biosynthesis
MESFEALKGKSYRIVMRDSTHIDHQMNVLKVENEKLKIPFYPDPVCLSRERFEYQNADEIWVLSKFAASTFVSRGISPDKIRSFSLGVDTTLFSPLSEKKWSYPLKLIYFGTLSVRKGIHHLLDATKKLPKDKFQVTLVGPIEKDFVSILKKYTHVTWFPPEPHSRLSKRIRQHDIYLFPSLEDGFPNTLVQAMASGLIPMTTNENGVSELIQNNVSGFVMPKVDSELWASKLLEIENQKEQLPMMSEKAVALAGQYPWDNYYRQISSRFLEIIHRNLQQRRAS